jgi:hypothetical protein
MGVLLKTVEALGDVPIRHRSSPLTSVISIISFLTSSGATVFGAPVISNVSPGSASVNAPGGVQLAMAGTGFVSGLQVLFNGTPVQPSAVSATGINVTIPQSLLQTAGVVSIVVKNPGGSTSGPWSFQIQSPPVISNISPAITAAGSPDLTIAIHGSFFISDSKVQFNSATLATTYISDEQLLAKIPSDLIATPGNIAITVTASSGVSRPLTFVIAPALAVTDLRLDQPLVPVQQSTTVMATAFVGSSRSLVPTSVTLTVSRQDGLPPIRYPMFDDGTNGDQVSRDSIYTAQLTLIEPSPTFLYAKASLTYQGLPQSVESTAVTILVLGNDTPQLMLNALASEIESGNMDQAALRFGNQQETAPLLMQLSDVQRSTFASAIRAASVVKSTEFTYVAESKWALADGTTVQLRMTLAKTPLGQWVVISW